MRGLGRGFRNVLGSLFGLVSRVSKVGYGGHRRVSRVLSRLTKSKERPSI